MNKLLSAITKINNIHPDTIENIKKEAPIGLTYVEYVKWIRQFLNINSPLNRYAEEYWLKRGWTEKPKSIVMPIKKSPFSIEFWIDKGLNYEQANYKRNSIRPICKEYWIERGYNDNDAITMAAYTKDKNNVKGNIAASKKFKRVNSIRCIEYWISYHLGDVELAKKSLAKIQTTFSKELCIKKYGEIDGTDIFNNRQIKWQNTIQSKSNIDEINKCKTHTLENYIALGKTKEDYIAYIEKRKLPIITNDDEMINFLFKYFSPIQQYNSAKNILNLLPKYITSLYIIDEEWLKKYYIIKEYNIFKNPHGYWNMYSKNGSLLRSSLEIIFYNMLIENNLEEDKDFIIEKKYNNSQEKCDFYITCIDTYIEIYGGYYTDQEDYDKKMEDKKNKYNNVRILKSNKEYTNLIQEIICKQQ